MVQNNQKIQVKIIRKLTVEYTADKIKAYFNLDVGLLRSYTVNNSDAFEMLVSLALYKILTFLEDGTRLRTACDLTLQGPLTIKEPEGFIMPERTSVLSLLKEKIAACKPLFADPAVTQLVTATVIKKKSST